MKNNPRGPSVTARWVALRPQRIRRAPRQRPVCSSVGSSSAVTPFGLRVAFAFTFALAVATAPAAALELHIDAGSPGPQISRYLYGQFMEHLGRGIYGGIWVGPDSRIPNRDGIRTDVFEALEALEIPVVRWPGGCFADEYHWRDGIGPRGERPVTINTSWGGVEETNAFGTHEFLDLAEALGADAYIAGNLGTGSPREMAEWLEYMTSDTRSTLAELRRRNGREEPWRVAFFGVGNESWGCGGNMRPEYYADLYRQTAEFLGTRNGRLSKIASGGYNELTEWTAELSRIGANIDGISHHYYTVPSGVWEAKGSATDFGEDEWISTLARTLRIEGYIERQETILDRNDPDGRIGLYVDEWGTWYDPEPGVESSPLYQQNTLRDAVVAALNFHVFHRHAERVRMANIAQTVNVLQAMILTDERAIVLTPTYHAFRMHVPFQDATRLPLEIDDAPTYTLEGVSVPGVSASAAVGEDGNIYVSLVNLDPSNAVSVTIDVAGRRVRRAEAEILTAEAMNSRNTFAARDAVAPAPFEGLTVARAGIGLELPAKSIVVMELD